MKRKELKIKMYSEKEHNIFWCGGMDSTYLVCKRVIIEKKPIQTYYLNFPCDGYYPPYPLGRDSREVEVKVMDKLREMIIKQFPYTKSLFPRTILVDEFPINKEVYKKLRFLHENYQYRYRPRSQELYMIQYSLDENKIFEYSLEDGMSLGVDVGYLPTAKLLKENFTEDFTISTEKILELEVFKNIYFPIFETWRKDMVEESRKYDFTNILENTWSCRWPKPNGDICSGVVDYDDENIDCSHFLYVEFDKQPQSEIEDGFVRYYKDNEYEIIKRKINYLDILND
jgi:hypothetical protein